MSNLPSPVYTETLKRLLLAEVICPWTAGEHWRFLEVESQRRQVENWVADLGYELALTSGGAGYHLVHRRVDEAGREDAKALFRDIMLTLREHLEVIALLMDVSNADATLAPGQSFRPNQVVAAAEENPNIREQVSKLTSSKPDRTLRQQVDSLVKALRDEGLIVPARQEGEVYLFTARLELIQDMIVFIQENEGLPLTGKPDDGQKDLL